MLACSCDVRTGISIVNVVEIVWSGGCMGTVYSSTREQD